MSVETAPSSFTSSVVVSTSALPSLNLLELTKIVQNLKGKSSVISNEFPDKYSERINFVYKRPVNK